MTLALAALATLSGCIAVPVGPGYYDGSPGYGYSEPAPAYYSAPAYYGPSIGIGIGISSEGGRGYGRGRGQGHR